jgi:hypothetical protein
MLYNIPEKKSLLTTELVPFFKELGFRKKVVANRNLVFYKSLENGDIAFLQCRILSMPLVEYIPIRIHISEVEKELVEIKCPHFSDSYYLEKNNPFNKVTLADSITHIRSKELNNIDDLIEFSQKVKSYVLSEGLHFIEKYGNISKAYAEVKTIQPGGEFFNTKLFPSEESIFRATIILKKFKDPSFNDYVSWFKRYISEKFRTPEEWLFAYEQLLKRL